MTAARMKSPNLELSLRLKHIHHLVCCVPFISDCYHAYSADIVLVSLGLQTPRLKRLAEIVSAQAIAQQERLEFGNGTEYKGADEDIAEADEETMEAMS